MLRSLVIRLGPFDYMSGFAAWLANPPEL